MKGELLCDGLNQVPLTEMYEAIKRAFQVLPIEVPSERWVGFEEPLDNPIIPLDVMNVLQISQIIYKPGLVYVDLGHKELAISLEEFEKNSTWINPNQRYRGTSFTNIQDNYPDAFGPIYVFAHLEDDLNVSYLSGIAEEDKQKMAIKGSLFHEVGHHVWNIFLTEEKRSDLLPFLEKPFTDYASQYDLNALFVEENFCEAMRLWSINKDLLAPEVVKKIDAIGADLNFYS